MDQVNRKFLERGLSAGTYKVTFEPKIGYQSVVKESVTVGIGKVTDLGTVTIL